MANDPYTNESDKRFTLRMDKTLFNRITQLAKHNRRSIAKEIETAVAMYADYAEELIASGADEDRIGRR